MSGGSVAFFLIKYRPIRVIAKNSFGIDVLTKRKGGTDFQNISTPENIIFSPLLHSYNLLQLRRGGSGGSMIGCHELKNREKEINMVPYYVCPGRFSAYISALWKRALLRTKSAQFLDFCCDFYCFPWCPSVTVPHETPSEYTPRGWRKPHRPWCTDGR